MCYFHFPSSFVLTCLPLSLIQKDAPLPLEGLEVEEELFESDDSDSSEDTEDDEELTSDEEVDDKVSPPPSVTTFGKYVATFHLCTTLFVHHQ
jgi:hypothetical protein